MTTKKILIVGGGFGGIKTALALSRDERLEVTLLSDHPDFRYYPTIYQTVTTAPKRNASIPIEDLIADTNITFVLGMAKTLDRKAKTITSTDGEIYHFDELVLSLGVITNFFGIKGLAEYAYGIKSAEEVQRLKTHLHQQLLETRAVDSHYVIVGAGPTGVELAGVLGAYIKKIAKKHGLTCDEVHIDLIEAAPRILPNLAERISVKVCNRLKKLGVTIAVGKAVQGETADTLMVSNEPLKSSTVIWTAGTTNNPFFKENTFDVNAHGKVFVDTYLQTEPNIYVIGDNANTPYSGMAQTAITDAEFLAENIQRKEDGKEMMSYDAKKPATVIPVGAKYAMVEWKDLTFCGKIGWFLRQVADIKGFAEYQSFARSLRQWSTAYDEEEYCSICKK